MKSFVQHPNRISRSLLLAILLTLGCPWIIPTTRATDPPVAPRPLPARPPNISLQHEVKHAIDKGLTWLSASQNTNGFWSTPEHPAVTALALMAYQGRPDARAQKTPPPAVKKGYDYLRGCFQPDGGIYRKDLPSYNTSISLLALLSDNNNSEWQPAILKARKFLIGLQAFYQDPTNSALSGGIGYGQGDKAPDLSNTAFALEALYHSKQLQVDRKWADVGDLNWAAAVRFLQNCQNLPGTNTQAWATGDPQNKGGFVYAPDASKAGETNVGGRVALRSYGSMSYAGLLSYIHADLQRGDPRVTAVLDWLQANYTLEENPGMGLDGLYYYFHTMTKALTVAGVDTLVTKDGGNVNWREKLALKLINLQRADGSWANDNGRWWEKDPNLVTAYSLIALDMIHGKL